MSFGADMDLWAANPSQQDGLGLVEKQVQSKFLGLSWPEIKLLIVAGVGFLADAYDLFVINMVVPMLLLAYYPPGQTHIPWGLDGGVLKASASIGNIIGQILFGLLGDTLGRSNVYGKELVVVIIAIILIISVPSTPHFSANAITAWIAAFRFVMGIGIGGDYPMSASVVSDRARLKTRGMLLAIIFSCQGLGNLFGGAAAVMVIAAFKGHVQNGDLHKLDGAWRILTGLSLVPAFGVIYFRFTLVESSRYKQARRFQDAVVVNDTSPPDDAEKPTVAQRERVTQTNHIKNSKSSEFTTYFSNARHLRLLFGSCVTFFLVDLSFYGMALNQSVLLSSIGFTAGSPWSNLMKTATGNLIITAAGFLPGYWITIALIEIIGRKAIQLIGFGGNIIGFAVLAIRYDELKHHSTGFFLVFVFLQLSFNFGANATTFIIAGEVFPTRVRASAHGLSASCGKIGAIIAVLGFATLARPEHIGNEGVFWIFTATSILGFIVTIFFTVETRGRDADLIDRQQAAADATVA